MSSPPWKQHFEENGRHRLIEVLAKSSLAVGDSTLPELLAAAVSDIVEFSAGEAILTEGEEGDELYFLLKGSACIALGPEQVNSRAAIKADHVGEMSMLDVSARRSATVFAQENTVAAILPAAAFIAIADGRSRLWRNLAAELAERLRQRNAHTVKSRQGPTVALHAPEWKQVAALLERVPAALKRWTWEGAFKSGRAPCKWHIENEYHVQNLLYAILTPVFPTSRRRRIPAR